MENENTEENQEEHIQQIHRVMEDIRAQMSHLQQMINEYGPVDDQKALKEKAAAFGSVGESRRGKVIEGVFDGQNMVGPDGKIYTVPANYASKSKLLEGDIMKLTITADGSFIYKQIGPVKRTRVMATLVRDEETAMYRAVSLPGRSYRLLTASVTYYKGEPGDTVVLLLPEDQDSRWGAIDNIVKNAEEAREMLSDGSEVELPGPHAELPLGDEMELPAPKIHVDDPNDESYYTV